jgi:hypothetical protein
MDMAEQHRNVMKRRALRLPGMFGNNKPRRTYKFDGYRSPDDLH